MTLDVYNTHMELYPYMKDDYPIIEDMYIATDKFTQKQFPCGYIIENGKLYLPRGTPVSKIELMCDLKANIIKDHDACQMMSKKYHSLYDPRDKLQEDSIKFLTETDNPQLALNLGTGDGKTFVTSYSSIMLQEKAIIITPNEGLKQQWINTYHKMFNCRPKNLMNIEGSHIMNAIMDDHIDPADGYFVNHQTLRSYMSQKNSYALHQFFRKIAVGIKVYDESHMEFANILLIDFFSNTKRTWYLTATFDRSDKTESRCFKLAFKSVETFGEMESKEIKEKHVIYHVVNINSRINPKQRARVIGFSGMSSISYGKYAYFDDPNETAYRTIRELVEKVKDVEGKILIFVPLIDAIDQVVKKLKKDVSGKSIAAFHSKISADEKESALKKDIIVSTIKGMGTGKDLPGLRVVICGEPIASKVAAEQMFGRLRPYKNEKDEMLNTYFYDIVDTCIAPMNWWWRARFKKIETLCKDVVYLNIDG